VTILSVAMVSACSDAATTPQNPPRSPTSEANSNRETVSVQLRSEATDLSTVGPDGRRVFGWNLLTGESSFLGDTVQVRLQGSVEYLDGSGPFGGFLRIVAEDSSQVALEVNGQATSGPDGTDFDGRMGFLGASGRYSDVITAGRFTGVRSAELGSPVEVTLDLLVERVTPESGQ
jgi:hypothetical protein